MESNLRVQVIKNIIYKENENNTAKKSFLTKTFCTHIIRIKIHEKVSNQYKLINMFLIPLDRTILYNPNEHMVKQKQQAEDNAFLLHCREIR